MSKKLIGIKLLFLVALLLPMNIATATANLTASSELLYTAARPTSKR
jgi:hypothetical protein